VDRQVDTIFQQRPLNLFGEHPGAVLTPMGVCWRSPVVEISTNTTLPPSSVSLAVTQSACQRANALALVPSRIRGREGISGLLGQHVQMIPQA